jgi:hypothetical protein
VDAGTASVEWARVGVAFSGCSIVVIVDAGAAAGFADGTLRSTNV